MNLHFHFDIIAGNCEPFGFVTWDMDASNLPDEGDKFDVTFGKGLPAGTEGVTASLEEFSGSLKVESTKLIDSISGGPEGIVLLEDVVLNSKRNAIRFRDFLENDLDFFVIDYERDFEAK